MTQCHYVHYVQGRIQITVLLDPRTITLMFQVTVQSSNILEILFSQPFIIFTVGLPTLSHRSLCSHLMVWRILLCY